MSLEKLRELTAEYEQRPLDEFLAAWHRLAANPAANDTVDGEIIPPARVDETVVDEYVARLTATADIDATLEVMRADKRVKARECIRIAIRLVPEAREPKSRNRALQVIQSHHATIVEHQEPGVALPPPPRARSSARATR